MSLLFNFCIVILSLFIAFKYYSSYHQGDKNEKVYPIDVKLEILMEKETGKVIYAKKIDGIQCPYQLINFFMSSLNEGFSSIDWSKDLYILRVSSEGNVVNTSYIRKDTLKSDTKIDANIIHHQQNVIKETIRDNRIVISGFSQIILPAH